MSPRPLALAAFTAALLLTTALRADPRTTLNFDADWRFYQGEPPAPAPAQTLSANYAPIDPASFAFKDDTWRTVTLPHDWSIEGPFAETNPTGAAGGYLPSGIAWYRKTFTLPATAGGGKGQRVFIEFDGVMSNSEVYLNKSLLGTRPNGYVPFRYDLTDYLNYTGPNLLAVRTDTSRQPASRWYTGAGINRHVRLVIENPVHLEPWATTVTTTKVDKQSATVHIKTTVINQSTAVHKISLGAAVRPEAAWTTDPWVIKEQTSAQSIAPGASATFELDCTQPYPHLWDTDYPLRYFAQVQVREGDQTLDAETIPFGIRTAEFKPDTGFYLNGKNIKLLGVALHSDMGALGTAVPASAWETRLTELKKYGINAIRTAHNPMPPEFYDVCDRLGLLVMDEAFDVWTVAKEPADYHLYFKDWWQRDLDAFITRDRNHPSVVIWSLGNEIWDILPQNPDPAADQFIGPNRPIDIAKSIFAGLRDRAHALDPTRPVTIAEMRPNVAGAYTNGFADMMDVIGQNYRDSELAAAHTQNPARKIIGTEDYKTRETWLALRDNPALSGQFLWAGADYIGETGAWPNIVSPSGILDRTNFPRGDALERDAWWSPATKPVVHLARMVTMPTRPGAKPVNMGFADWTPAPRGSASAPATTTAPAAETVSVYSNCDTVELILNDQSLGTKPLDPADTPRQWQVPFTPGTLKAIAKNKKNEIVATDELHTAAAPAKILLTAERTTLPHDWDDVLYIRATIADAAGTRNPNATPLVKFTLTGPAALVAVDNGDVKSHEPFNLPQRTAYQGTCIAILRSTADTGPITLTATAEGLAPATVTIQAAPPAR